MFKILRGTSGDRAFRWATMSVLVLLVMFFAAIVVAMLSYTNWSTFFDVLFSEEIVFAIRLSLTTATVTTVISMLVAIPTAYAISKSRFRGKDIVDSMLDLPIVISPVALGAALLVFFSTSAGSAINDRIPFVFTVAGIVLAQFTVVCALAIRLLKSTFDGIDPRYEQVCRTLGCGKPEAFFRVVLPLARDGLIASGILTWARAVGEFGATVTLAGATTMKTETLPISIFLSLASADIDKAIAVIFVLIIIAMIALLVIRKLTGRRYAI